MGGRTAARMRGSTHDERLRDIWGEAADTELQLVLDSSNTLCLAGVLCRRGVGATYGGTGGGAARQLLERTRRGSDRA